MRIVLSGFADTAAVVEAINDGQIYKFMPKPWNDEDLKQTIRKGIEGYSRQKRNLQLLDELKVSNDKLRKTNQTLEFVAQHALNASCHQQEPTLYQHIISSLPMGIIGVDPEGTICLCNDAALSLLGDSGLNVLGRPWSAALPDMFRPFLQKLIEQGELSENCRIGKRKGWIKGNKVPLDSTEGLVLAFDLEEDHV